MPLSRSASSADRAADYLAKNNNGKAKDSTLEILHFNINNNYYWVKDSSEVLFHWGAAWKYNTIYGDLNKLARELNFESAGKIVNPIFNDWQDLDFRIPQNSPLLQNDLYPDGKIPRVKVGILEK